MPLSWSDPSRLDITTCTLALDADDLETVAGDRPFHIFTSIGTARSWLTSHRESYDPAALSTGPAHVGAAGAPSDRAARNRCLASSTQSG
jgi:hypothetical protein